MLAGAGYRDRDVERRANDFAGETDLFGDGAPAEVGDRTARSDCAAEKVRQSTYDSVSVELPGPPPVMM